VIIRLNLHYFVRWDCVAEFAKINGAKIILRVKSPTFRAAKLNGFTVLADGLQPTFLTDQL